MRRILPILFLLIMTIPGAVHGQGSPGKSAGPYAVEYYYKVKWGHSQEFLQLFKKNHYPLLKKEVEMGRLLKVSMQQPQLHMTEDARWDYRVTIVFKNPTQTRKLSSSNCSPTRTRLRKKNNAASKSSMPTGICQ
jgi:hypothetical protein